VIIIRSSPVHLDSYLTFRGPWCLPQNEQTNPEISLVIECFSVVVRLRPYLRMGTTFLKGYWFEFARVKYNESQLAIKDSTTIAVGICSTGHDDCPAVLTSNGMLVAEL